MSDTKDKTLYKPGGGITLGSQKGLHQRLSNPPTAGATPVLQINFNRIFLLPDCSGSMDDNVVDGGVHQGTKIELLKQAFDTYLKNCFVNVNLVGIASFPEQAFEHPTGDHSSIQNLVRGLAAGGDTPMGDALAYIVENEQFTHAVIVSDGCANDSNDALAQAKLFKQKGITCDCVHIGNDSSGEQLLKEIAETTGGSYIKFTNVANFAKTFSFLAPAKRAQLATSRNPVALLGAAEYKP